MTAAVGRGLDGSTAVDGEDRFGTGASLGSARWGPAMTYRVVAWGTGNVGKDAGEAAFIDVIEPACEQGPVCQGGTSVFVSATDGTIPAELAGKTRAI